MSIKDNWINKKIAEIVVYDDKGSINVYGVKKRLHNLCKKLHLKHILWIDEIDTKDNIYKLLSEFYDKAEKICDDIEEELWSMDVLKGEE